MATLRKSLKLPSLRLYQQVIIYFIAVVFIPLTGASFIIYNINQTALRKELLRFTEYTSESIYADLVSQIAQQQEQIALLRDVLTQDYQRRASLPEAADRLFALSPPLDAVALYDAQGRQLAVAYRNIPSLSPTRRLPERVPVPTDGDKPTLSVLHNARRLRQESPYALRALMPLTPAPAGRARFALLQKRFDYLHRLIQSNNKVFYGGFYLFDAQGAVLAGPQLDVASNQRINGKDLRFFKTLKPGVTQQFSTETPTIKPVNKRKRRGRRDNDDEPPPLQKVFVKIPELGWGLVIESPYNVRQRYVRRARNQTLLLIAACLALVTAFGVFYSLGLHRNFRQLIKGVKAMAEGRYSRRIRLITNWFTPYEIVFLTGEFNRMGRKISESWEESQQLTGELREANAQLAKLDEMKSNLIDTVSHELRTPLTSIKGHSSRLIRHEGKLDADTRLKSLRVIKSQSDRLSRLVDDLLAIPELESHHLRVFLDQTPLPELMDRCVHFIQQKQDRVIAVQFRPAAAEPGAPPDDFRALADPDRLEQIVLNLLDNAVKYSLPETAIEVRVSPQPDAATGAPMLAIEVINACAPIAQEDLDTLFEKFKRLDDGATRTTRGTGLGLYITRGLVEAMGGVITLRYETGWFCARVCMPRYQEPLAAANQASGAPEAIAALEPR
ncbi:MAG: HAMP domain-containing histidine kinase [Vampirovibrionales bacterium]|nr:HAMP domain-containing histidine kinase [Vampirovibrionales bacterium]